ncbi:MAG: hypothetical protein IPI68_00615 [Chitinophagaceae bacterium]|nr:hypothetical protein [Chitinophagaceae bacterium]
MKKIIQYAILVLITAVSFLFSPKPVNNNGPDKHCPTNYIRLNNSLGFSMNCDAVEYIGLSVKPSLLFKQGNRRQSRMFYILYGSAAGYSIYFLTSPIHKTLNNIVPKQFETQIPNKKVSVYISHYAGLVFFNLLILIFALLLYEKIIFYYTGPWKNSALLRITLLLLLISNNSTKTFFWTPHQQMFNTLLPLFSIGLFIWLFKNHYSKTRLFFISFLCGTLLLFYGSFLVLLPVLLVSVFYKNRKILKQKFTQASTPVLLSFVAFTLPIFVWIIFLKFIGVNFYSHETAYFRQFIWIFDALKSPDRNLASELALNLLIYLKTSAPVIFAIIFLLISFFFSYNKLDSGNLTRSKHFNFNFISVALLIFIFFWLMGYYADRLTYTLSPVIICYAAILLNSLKLNNVKTISIVCLVLLWHIFILMNEMPHFTDRFYY